VLYVGFIAVGGFEAAMFKFMNTVANTTILHRMVGAGDDESSFNCGIPPNNSLHFFRAADDASLPWPGIVFGLSILSVWYWCTDQVCYCVVVLLSLVLKTYVYRLTLSRKTQTEL